MTLKKFWLILGLLPICLFLLILVQWPDQRIHVVACDVGQGDAILITHGFQQVLIDAGLNDGKVLVCLLKHVPVWDRKLDLVVVTHSDSDHSGGLKSVFEQYAVGTILANSVVVHKMAILGLLRARLPVYLFNHNSPVPLFQPRVGECFPVDPQMQFCLASPDLSQIDSSGSNQLVAETILSDADSVTTAGTEDNNGESVVLFGHLDDVDIALMGDLPASNELALLQKGVIEPVEILKVGHHGSKNSTNNKVLQKMSPEISLISVGKNNRYGHPAPAILDSLTELGSKIYRTDQDGDIEVVIEGNRYWVSQNRSR